MDKKWLYISIPILSIVLFISAAIVVGKSTLDIIFADACGNNNVQTFQSPDAEKVAYMFERDCGATTGISYQLSLFDANEGLPNKSGNTFVSSKPFTIQWIDDETLTVNYIEFAHTFEMDKRVNGTKIKYVTDPN